MTLGLTITMTNAGLARFTAAQLGAGIDLAISSVGLTDTDFVVSPTLEALPGEFRRIDTISGKAVGDNTIHLTMRDDAEIGYTARGFGLFLADGTLFAVYGQTERLFEKSPLTTFMAAIDLAFPTPDIDNLTFGNTDFLNPPATTTTKGVVELATQAEANTGTDTRRVAPISVMVATIAASITALSTSIDTKIAALSKAIYDRIDVLFAAIVESFANLSARSVYGSGLVKGGGTNDTNRTLTVDAATGADVRAGARQDVAVTPASLGVAGMIYLVEVRDDVASRYRRYSDGLIEMSGIAALPTTESAFTLNFPWPFENECECIFTTIINSAQTNQGQSTVQEVVLTKQSATLFAQNHLSPTVDAAGGFRWFARGH